MPTVVNEILINTRELRIKYKYENSVLHSDTSSCMSSKCIVFSIPQPWSLWLSDTPSVNWSSVLRWHVDKSCSGVWRCMSWGIWSVFQRVTEWRGGCRGGKSPLLYFWPVVSIWCCRCQQVKTAVHQWFSERSWWLSAKLCSQPYCKPA